MTAGGLFPGHEAIEALIRVDGVLGLPYEIPLEFERLQGTESSFYDRTNPGTASTPLMWHAHPFKKHA
jgi:hypothetical protein